MPIVSFPQKPDLPEHELSSVVQAVIGLLTKTISDRGPHVPELIYHYTDPFGLKGIVENGNLRATHVAFMNDASEYAHSAELLLAEIETQFAAVTDDVQRQLLHEMRPWLANLRPERFQNFAVICFSAAENSLNQWRSYARGEGGFSIGFDREALAERAEQLGGGLYPVVYDPEEQASLVRSVLSWALDEYPRRAATYPKEHRSDHLQRWLTAYMQCLGNGAPLLKRNDFSEEQEWRVVWRIANPTSVQFNPKQEILSAFVDLEFGTSQTWPDPWPVGVPKPSLPPKLPIRRLWIGPGRYKDLSALSASALLSNKGYWDVEIRVSDVPFRIVR